MASVKEIDALLPQTQCGECDFPGCLPYAEALAQGTAAINKCPPGGVTTVKALGTLLEIDPDPYLQKAESKTRAPSVAVIQEAECIGCTKCIKACPVDAIIGSGKLMHAVIDHECTGCGLCVGPCPVDCIEMVTIPQINYDKELARKRFNDKQTRILREEHEKQNAYREKRQLALKVDKNQEIRAKQDYIQQALARVKAKKS
ncbi:electron transport complex protein [Legionella wadsworthii]|uniref:Electron transport complex protein n=1 Tax=Legionella wadsworthii TaxID=28088 RepID=A0A378LV49_9GAMM|nr:RnfABCDGE type electron transport complex subunit B [Legionella wadsworthii]STY27971.1 electron transport complex protein [Legionella wadsworthii]